MKKSKIIILVILFLFAAGIILFFTIPSTYYMRRAIGNGLPKIDQYTIFENRIVEALHPVPWPVSRSKGQIELDKRFHEKFDELETIAYLIIRSDSILFEKYWDGYGPSSLSNSFSMAKSIVSLMVGIAIEEGHIEGVDQPVSDYIPELGSFNGKALTIEHLLTMSAGIRWDESYAGLFSVTTRSYYGKDLPLLMSGIRQVEEPGVRTVYQSGVTQLLAMVLERATGRTISRYASEKLWTPICAEHDALWSLDKNNGTEKAFCCFNSNARDFARFGQLLLNGGTWNGNRVVPEWYIEKATTPATWLTAENDEGPNYNYGYQFWILERDGEQIPYMRGILGQYVFVVPRYDAIIVRLGKKRSETRSHQNYPDDIDTWLDAGMDILIKTPGTV